MGRFTRPLPTEWGVGRRYAPPSMKNSGIWDGLHAPPSMKNSGIWDGLHAHSPRSGGVGRRYAPPSTKNSGIWDGYTPTPHGVGVWGDDTPHFHRILPIPRPPPRPTPRPGILPRFQPL